MCVCVSGVCEWCVVWCVCGVWEVFGAPGDQVYLDAAQVEAQRDGNLHLGLKEAQNNNNKVTRCVCIKLAVLCSSLASLGQRKSAKKTTCISLQSRPITIIGLM